MKMVVKASSFADPKDVEQYHKWVKEYKAGGLSHDEAHKKALKKGDNAVGCWGHSTATGSGPSCAIPPDHMISHFGSISSAREKKLRVRHGDKEVICVVKDRMPWIKNITNGARIDLNPDAAKALGLTPPFLKNVEYEIV